MRRVPKLIRATFAGVAKEDIEEGTDRAICAYLAHPEHYDAKRAPLDAYVAGIARRKVCSILRSIKCRHSSIDALRPELSSPEAQADLYLEAAATWRCLLQCVARTPADRSLLRALRRGIRDPQILIEQMGVAVLSPEEACRRVKSTIQALRNRRRRLCDGRLDHHCQPRRK